MDKLTTSILRLLVFISIVLLFCKCSSDGGMNSNYGNFKIEKERLIDASEMEKAGFIASESAYLSVLKRDGNYFILGHKEKLVAKFNSEGRAESKYSFAGQGPGEFLNPASIFWSEQRGLGVFDIRKSTILWFTDNLDFVSESRVAASVRRITDYKGRLLAFGSFGNRYYGWLSDSFEVEDTFGKIPEKSPLRNVYRTFLYMGFFLNNKVSCSSWGYYDEKCEIDLIQPVTGELLTKLCWDNPHLPSESDVELLRNLCFCSNIIDNKKYYIVSIQLLMGKKSDPVKNLLVFNKRGKYEGTMEVDFDFVNSDRGLSIAVEEPGNVFSVNIIAKSML